jgi:hypothetical protein
MVGVQALSTGMRARRLGRWPVARRRKGRDEQNAPHLAQTPAARDWAQATLPRASGCCFLDPGGTHVLLSHTMSSGMPWHRPS